MDVALETRLLVGDLISRCTDVGMSKAELMKIITGDNGDVSTLLTEVTSSERIETRALHLHEVVRIARSICGAEAEPWLRTQNEAFGQRSPLDTLLQFPGALAGMMHLMRRMGTDGDSVH